MERSYEHLFLDLKWRLTRTDRPERYLLLFPNGQDRWTAEVLASSEPGSLLESADGQTAREALQALVAKTWGG
jgi:hypothetical protein